MPFNDQLKQTLRERAGYVCEYCHSPERLSANRFTVDHVIPKSLGGSDELDNLALACGRARDLGLSLRLFTGDVSMKHRLVALRFNLGNHGAITGDCPTLLNPLVGATINWF